MPHFENTVLFIPEKADAEIDAAASEREIAGGQAVRLASFWKPPAAGDKDIKVYGHEMFCLVLVHKLGLHLVSPADDFLGQLEYKGTKCDIAITSLDERLKLDAETAVIVSEIVSFESEVRCFTLNGDVKSLAAYEGSPNISEARAFIEAFLSENNGILPITTVIDIGFISERGWAAVEANAVCGAGLNGCDAKSVIDCIYFAAENGS